jgi:hypothetical protein
MNTNLVATGSPAATDVSFEPGTSAVGGETVVPQTSAEVRADVAVSVKYEESRELGAK